MLSDRRRRGWPAKHDDAGQAHQHVSLSPLSRGVLGRLGEEQVPAVAGWSVQDLVHVAVYQVYILLFI